jgi:hypothetical protein
MPRARDTRAALAWKLGATRVKPFDSRYRILYNRRSAQRDAQAQVNIYSRNLFFEALS